MAHTSGGIGVRENLPNGISLLAVGLFVASALYFGTVPRFEPPFGMPLHGWLHAVNHALWWEFYVAFLVLGTALYSWREGTLTGAWLLAFAVGAGIGVNLGGFAVTGTAPDLPFRVGWGVVVGVSTAFVFGTLGYALGRGGRRLWGS